MALTQKHFRSIADMLNLRLVQAATSGERALVAQIARDMAAICKADNPRFKKEKFFEAVGLTSYGCLS